MKVATIVGARPNFIKAVLVSQELKRRGVKELLIHTGQHYDWNLSGAIFKDLKLKPPNVNLEIGSGFQGEQTGKMLIGIEKALLQFKPKSVIVYGDTNSTLAGALAAVKLKIPTVHVEAGERSGDKQSPEEINRIICDHAADVNCCATKKAVKNLDKEGIKKSAVWTGDVMLDLLLRYRKVVPIHDINKPKSKYYLLTLHRAENVNDGHRLRKIIDVLGNIPLSLVWPIHPRTEKMINQYRIDLPVNIKKIPPVSYTRMIELIIYSKRVITDSGGIQKEAYWLGVPCLTLLEKTTWTETLRGGWNYLIGENLDSLLELSRYKPSGPRRVFQFGNAKAAKRISELVVESANDSFDSPNS